MTLTLSIQLTSAGRTESFSVEADRVRIGSAAYCEVRLPLGEAAPVQLVLEDAGPLGLRVEVLADSPPALIAGKPLSTGVFPSSAQIEIGRNRIGVATLMAAVPGASSQRKSKTSPVTLLAAAIAIPFGFAQLAFSPRDEGLTSPTKPPALFASARPNCPQTEPGSALAFAAQERELGDSKRERRPFRAADGVRAVGLYRMTAACLRSGGDSARANDADRAADALERDLTESYRTHRVRLDHALSTKNYVVAQSEVRALRDLLSGTPGEYVTWLESLSRRLSLRLGKKR